METAFENREGVLGGEAEPDSTHTRRNYLVDVENTGNLWMDCILQRKEVRIFLFFTAPSPHITYADLAGITGIASEIKCFECNAGQNAVDFQLVSYLGLLLASATSSDEFVILSNDKGYDCVCQFWKKRGYQIQRMGTKKLPDAVGEEAEKEAPNRNRGVDPDVRLQCIELIKNVLPQKDRGTAVEIFAVLEHHKSSNLQAIYHAFVKKYGQKQGLSHYTHVRAVIRKIQTLLN